MAGPKSHADEIPADMPDDGDEGGEDEGAPGARCPLCEMLAGECDHLVATIDLTYAELVAGAIFAHERLILDLFEHLAASDPEALKAAGSGPVLEHLATLVRGEMDDGAGAGDAVSIHYPQLMAALSHMLQEAEHVTATEIEGESAEDSSVQNLWAQDPEWIVESLIERLQGLREEIEQA